jgi:hypothetical protein
MQTATPRSLVSEQQRDPETIGRTLLSNYTSLQAIIPVFPTRLLFIISFATLVYFFKKSEVNSHFEANACRSDDQPTYCS